MTEVKLLTAKEVQPILRKRSTGAVYDLVPSLPAGVVVRLNRTILFNEVALLEWLAKGGSASTPENEPDVNRLAAAA